MKLTGIDRVIRSRVQLLTAAPFWGALVLRLALAPDSSFDTMATDGESIFVNVSFADSLTEDELRGVLAHEAAHCALSHMTRRGSRDPLLWNEACDYSINSMLLAAGFVLPKGALIDPSFDGMTPEQIYSIRENQKQQQQQGQQQQQQQGQPGAASGGQQQTGQGQQPGQQPGAASGGQQGQQQQPGGRIAPGPDRGRCGQVLDAPQGQAGRLDAEWKGAALQAAAIAAKGAGDGQAGLDRVVTELRKPRVNWRDTLRDIVSESVQTDDSWNRPNRRFIAGGLYLPSQQITGRGHIVVAIDNSGSLPPKALSAFGGELQAMFEDETADRFTVIHCDNRLRQVREYEAGDKLDLTAKGGGGTSFVPVMEWLQANGADVACLIYFTDLDCPENRFGDDPGLPVIWINWSRPRPAPFGHVIQLDAHA
jgi:predicted metal-dependent peptidase